MIMDIIRQLYSVSRLDIASTAIAEDIDILMIIRISISSAMAVDAISSRLTE